MKLDISRQMKGIDYVTEINTYRALRMGVSKGKKSAR